MYDRGEIMSINEQKTILKFIYDDKFLCSTLSANRADFEFDLTTKNIPIEIFKIKQRILERENLKEYDSHTYLGDLITFILPGGRIPRHTDKNGIDGRIHVRFNVFLQLPSICQTFYDGILVDTIERHYVMCRSGIDIHWTDINRSNMTRIALSFGFMLPIDKVSELYKIPSEHNTGFRNMIQIRYIYYLILSTYKYFRFGNRSTTYDPKIPFVEICGEEATLKV